MSFFSQVGGFSESDLMQKTFKVGTCNRLLFSRRMNCLSKLLKSSYTGNDCITLLQGHVADADATGYHSYASQPGRYAGHHTASTNYKQFNHISAQAGPFLSLKFTETSQLTPINVFMSRPSVYECKPLHGAPISAQPECLITMY